jgi:hypothetical protein
LLPARPRILIVKVSSLGDVVHNMPLVHDLRARWPDAEIDWVVEEGYVDLVRLLPEVGRVIPFALRRWRKRFWRARPGRRLARCAMPSRRGPMTPCSRRRGSSRPPSWLAPPRVWPGRR